MTDAVETNLGRKPEQLSADAGYCSEADLEALENRDIDGVCGDRPGQGCCRWHGQRRGHRCSTGQPGGGRTDTGRGDACKIKAGGHESPYRLRKQLPEPVFGQIKQARGFRQFPPDARLPEGARLSGPSSAAFTIS